MPVPKKNRVRLGTTREEPGEGENANENENDIDNSSSSDSSTGGNLEAEVDPETTTPPPGSPGKGPDAAELVTSPRFESNVRQISRQVSTMTWEEGSVGSQQPPPSSAPGETLPDVVEEAQGVQELEPLVSPTPPPGTGGSSSASAVAMTDSLESAGSVASTAIADTTTDDQTKASTESESKDNELEAGQDSTESDKPLKRKISDRLPSASAEEPPKKAGTEPAKRARDDPEEDVNPREKKRPTPPPEEQDNDDEGDEDAAAISTPPEPASPAPKMVRHTLPFLLRIPVLFSFLLDIIREDSWHMRLHRLLSRLRRALQFLGSSQHLHPVH